jgi:hypothetical protein
VTVTARRTTALVALVAAAAAVAFVAYRLLAVEEGPRRPPRRSPRAGAPATTLGPPG